MKFDHPSTVARCHRDLHRNDLPRTPTPATRGDREARRTRLRRAHRRFHLRISGRPGRAADLRRFLDTVATRPDFRVARRIDIADHWRSVHPADRWVAHAVDTYSANKRSFTVMSQRF
jgi:hypothetical protein